MASAKASKVAKKRLTPVEKAAFRTGAQGAVDDPGAAKILRGAGWYSPESEDLSCADVAELFGVTKQAVSKWYKDCECPRGMNMKYCFRDVLSWYVDWKVQSRCEEVVGAAATKDDKENGINWKKDKEESDAKMAKIRLKKLKGELIEKTEATRRENRLAVMFRDMILGLGAKIAPSLYGREVAEIEHMLNDETETRLREICGDADREA